MTPVPTGGDRPEPTTPPPGPSGASRSDQREAWFSPAVQGAAHELAQSVSRQMLQAARARAEKPYLAMYCPQGDGLRAGHQGATAIVLARGETHNAAVQAALAVWPSLAPQQLVVLLEPGAVQYSDEAQLQRLLDYDPVMHAVYHMGVERARAANTPE